MSQPVQDDSTFLYCDSNVLHDESNFHHYDSFFLQYKSAWDIMNQLFFNMSQLLILLSQLLILMSQPFFIVTHFSSSWNNLRHFNSISSNLVDRVWAIVVVVVNLFQCRVINISSVMEFQRWSVLKSKVFGQESTCHQEKIFKKNPTSNDSLSKSAKIVL